MNISPPRHRPLTADEQKAWLQYVDACERIRKSAGPPPGEGVKEKEARIEHLLKPENALECFQYYFPEYCKAPFGWFHKLAVKNVIIDRYPEHLWEWPREYAKTIFSSLFIPAREYMTGWLKGFTLASENEGKAKTILKNLQANLTYNPRIVADFGDPGITGSWLDAYFSTKDSVGFWGFGLGQNPAGVHEGPNRPNLAVVSDADNKDKAKNQLLTKDRVDWIKGELKGCLYTEDNIFIYENNRVHKRGLTAHMAGDIEEGDPKDDAYKHIKVYWTEDPVTHQMLTLDEGGVPAWSERFSKAQARRKIKSMGYRNAMRQLYHWHIEDGKIFTDENMPWVDPLELYEYDAVVSYCDPAYGESKKGCYRAIVLVGVKGHNYDILWAWLKQNGSFAKVHRRLAENIEDEKEVYPVKGERAGLKTKIDCQHWVETGSLQKLLVKKIYKEENLNYRTPWYPRYDMDRKGDKITRIESLETIADNQHMRFNANMRKHPMMLLLRDQFKGFPHGFIDGPDGVHGGITKLGKRVKKKKSKMRAGNYARNPQR